MKNELDGFARNFQQFDAIRSITFFGRDDRGRTGDGRGDLDGERSIRCGFEVGFAAALHDDRIGKRILSVGDDAADREDVGQIVSRTASGGRRVC